MIEATVLFGAPADADRSRDPSAERDPFDGRLRRRLGAGAARQPRHAHADRACAGISGADRIGRAPSSTLPTIGALDFEAPDPLRFPCLALAFARCRRAARAPALLNAANEMAVEAFLRRGHEFRATSTA